MFILMMVPNMHYPRKLLLLLRVPIYASPFRRTLLIHYRPNYYSAVTFCPSLNP